MRRTRKGAVCMQMHSSELVFKRFIANTRVLLSIVFVSVSFPQNALAVMQPSSLQPNIPVEQQASLKSAQESISNKDYQKAVALADSVLEANPKLIVAQFIRAQGLSLLGNIDEAISMYEAILKSNQSPRHSLPEIYNNLATLYAMQGKLDVARQTLEKGIATNEQYKTLYENLSAIYVEMARGAYSKALKLGVQAKAVQLKTLPLSNFQLAASEQAQSVAQLEKQPAIKSQPIKSNEKAVIVKAVTTDKVVTPKQTDTQSNLKQQQLALLKKADKVKTVQPEKNSTIKVASKQEIKTEFSNKRIPPVNKDEVITALHGWAAAWSAQAVDLYLSFYGEGFKPKKISKKVWAVQRRIRISKPRWVSVRLNEFDVKADANKSDKVIVQLVQDYRADNYRDKTKKQFVMQRTIDGWRILSEQSLAVIR